MRKVLVLLLLLATTACIKGGVSPTKVVYPNSVSSEMRAEFERSEEEFKAQRYPQAESGYRAYIGKFPYNELTDTSLYRIGQIQMLRKEYDGATLTFDQLIGKTPDPDVASRARVKAGICQFRLNQFDRSLGYFDKTEPHALGENDRIKLGGLGLAALEKTGGSAERRGFYDAVLLDTYQGMTDAAIQQKYSGEAPMRPAITQDLQSWAKVPASISQVDPRFKNYKAKASEPYVAYKLGMAYNQAGDTKNAKKYLGRLQDKYPGNPLAKDAAPTLAKLGYKPGKEGKPSGKLYKVGVILPLTGKYEVYGASTLKGMECAASVKAPCSGVNNLEIISRDDQGDPNLAVQAVESLVRDEKVSAIIGPLSSASAQAAAKKAQELGVVMISLAQKEGIPAIGDKIFRFSLTPGEQVRALLNEAVKKDQKKSIAVLYPTSNYGKVMMATMKDMAPSYGAAVTASQGYGSASDAANQLRQLKFSVSQISAANPLGFDSLFIPDSYASVLKIAPAFRAAGIENVLLLGTNAWNDPSLATKSGGLLDKSVFLDIYFKESDAPAVREFVQEFQAAFGGSPSTLEAMGYDSVRFLGHALHGRKGSSGEEVRQAVSGMRGFRGVTGLRSFLPDREAQVEPYLLTVEGGQIKELK
ncbi:MAG TPA: penicillin-binding protein activator [bacterium]|nr:penicillin-binding protein activator [bacterium]